MLKISYIIYKAIEFWFMAAKLRKKSRSSCSNFSPFLLRQLPIVKIVGRVLCLYRSAITGIRWAWESCGSLQWIIIWICKIISIALKGLLAILFGEFATLAYLFLPAQLLSSDHPLTIRHCIYV